MIDLSATDSFTFNISLSVLNHLGRNLYRSFTTVLGEAVSNSWDADATNVWIYVDRKNGRFFIKDDGVGMDANDFQNKFLKIGYTKRKEGVRSPKGRPYIGRKGIGKLALLSCAEKVSIISKVKGGFYVGGVIDNSSLDKAITDDLTPTEYPLGFVDIRTFNKYIKNHESGTIIYFENIKDGIRNTIDYLRKIIALYFRFSVVDKSFNIYLNDKKITIKDLNDLCGKTEFLWIINNLDDPFVKKGLVYNKNNKKNIIEPPIKKEMRPIIKGFIASVRLPKDLKVMGTDERIGIDLFVNGRLRERDIVKHIESARIAESYLYGQIHYNDLDDEIDRFSTSREGVVPNDVKFNHLLSDLQKLLGKIFSEWDDLRRKHRQTGDPENPSITKKERKAEELFNEVSEEYETIKDPENPEQKEKVDSWVNDLLKDARFNFPSYAECFISENLIRKHIEDQGIAFSKEAKREIKRMKQKEQINKDRGNLSIDIRKSSSDTSYLSMDHLANLVDKRDAEKKASLSRDANEYKPIRDAVAHTALITDPAKSKLTSVFENIKGRVRTLLS